MPSLPTTSLLFILLALTPLVPLQAQSSFTNYTSTPYPNLSKLNSTPTTGSQFEVYRAFPYWRTEPTQGPWSNLSYSPFDRTLNISTRYYAKTSIRSFLAKWWRYGKLPGTGKAYTQSNLPAWNEPSSHRLAYPSPIPLIPILPSPPKKSLKFILEILFNN